MKTPFFFLCRLLSSSCIICIIFSLSSLRTNFNTLPPSRLIMTPEFNRITYFPGSGGPDLSHIQTPHNSEHQDISSAERVPGRPSRTMLKSGTESGLLNLHLQSKYNDHERD